MSQYFYHTLLRLTIAGSFPLLLIWVVTPFAKRGFGSTWHYYIRLIPTLLYLLPFPQLFVRQAITQPVTDAPSQPIEYLGEFLTVAAQESAPPAITNAMALTPGHVLVAIWVIGAAAMMLFQLIAWIRFTKALRKHCMPIPPAWNRLHPAVALKQRVRIFICDQIGSPMLVGFLHPKILLPNPSIPPSELHWIIQHELTHLRRGDLYYKLLVSVVRTLHWFNPMAWLLMKQINELCEFSCDSWVVHGLDQQQRRDYGFTLLNQISQIQEIVPPISTGFNHRKQQLKRRLNNIMNLRPQKRFVTFFSVFAAVSLCAVSVVTASSVNPAADCNSALQQVVSTMKATSGLLTKATSSSTADAEEQALKMADQNESEQPQLETLDWNWPVGGDGGYVVIPYRGYHGHTGMDITAADQSILATASGTVITAIESESGYGNQLVLDHGNGITSLYAHCNEFFVKEGDSVKAGDQIATMGKTGYATGIQLHLEVRLDDTPINPMNYLWKVASKDQLTQLHYTSRASS